MTQTTPAPDAGTPELCPYDKLGTHMMRYTAQDAERIKEELLAARDAFPGLLEAFRANDAKLFTDRMIAAEVHVLMALAKATWVLEELKRFG